MAGYNTEVNTLQQIHNHVGYLCTPFSMVGYNTEVNTLQQIHNRVGIAPPSQLITSFGYVVLKLGSLQITNNLLFSNLTENWLNNYT